MLIPRVQAVLSEVVGRGVVVKIIQRRNDGFREKTCPSQGLCSIKGGIQRNGNNRSRKGGHEENRKRQRAAEGG